MAGSQPIVFAHPCAQQQQWHVQLRLHVHQGHYLMPEVVQVVWTNWGQWTNRRLLLLLLLLWRQQRRLLLLLPHVDHTRMLPALPR